MRYFCFLGLMTALIACGSEKSSESPKASEFVMPPESGGNYAGTPSSGQAPGYTTSNDSTATPGYNKPAEPGLQGDNKVAPAEPKIATPKLAPAQTQKQKPFTKGYAPSCCLEQYDPNLSQSLAPTGQAVPAGCYALDDVCNIYPTQCVVVACPANLTL